MSQNVIRLAPWIAPFAIFCCESASATITPCVATLSDLQTAITNVGTATDDTVIKVVRGIYSPTQTVDLYSFSTHAVTLEGGYDATCTATTGDSSNTVIDGSSLSNADFGLQLVAFGGGNLTVRYLKLQNFNTHYEVFHAECHGGDMLVENNRFFNNAISIASTGPFYFDSVPTTRIGSVVIRNNLVVGTKIPDGMFALTIFPATSNSNIVANMYFTNNTVADTTALGTNPSGGVYIATVPASTPAILSNNILWNNAGGDLTLLVVETLDHNDIGVQSGVSNLAGSSGNVSVDPKFGDNGSYVLSSASTLLDQGNPSAVGGVGTLDAWGMPRLTPDNTIDMGALQHDRIFLADFD